MRTPPTRAGTSGVAVQVQEVTSDTIATENKVSGKIAADNETSIYVASSVKCTAVYVQAGDTVQAGQKICTLDLDSTLSSYNAANISYDSAAQSYQDQKGPSGQAGPAGPGQPEQPEGPL